MVQKTDDVDFDLSKGGEHARDVQTRHTAFLKKRCNPDAASATFRPRKRNRQSVVKALRLWDNQIRASTDTQGLVYFSFDEKSLADPTKWMEEPSISAATDMGGDMVSTAHACLYYPPVQALLSPSSPPAHHHHHQHHHHHHHQVSVSLVALVATHHINAGQHYLVL